MELDFSDQIRQLGLSSEKKQKSSEETHAEMDMQTKKDNPEMAMQNKSVCKVCKAKWGSCAHISDPSNKMEQEETMQHESTETKEEESKEDTQAGMGDKACAGCECGKNESECTCADCTTKASKEMDKYGDPNAEKEMKMEKSMSEKKSMHLDKEDKKDIESEKSKPDAEKEEEKSSKKKKFPFNKSKASLAEKIAYILQSKIDTHNEKHEQSITFAQLNKVYSRGLNVYKTTHRPRISLHQWAMARVNLFLKMKSGARVNAQYSLLDTDIANASGETIVESGLASYDFIDFTELEFQLAKISLVEAGLTENEMNFELIEAEEKKKLPSGSKKKFGVYVKNDKNNTVMVKFGDPNMSIKRDDPERRKSYRARHGCDNPGPKWKANYWSCKMWSKTPVSKITSSEKCGCDCGQCDETDIQDLVEIEGAKKGLWENIRDKKKRMGKNYKPAKPGSKDYPDKEAYKKAQGEEYEWDGEEEFLQEDLLFLDPSLANVEIIEE